MACILVIDDEPIVRTVIRKYLEIEGHEVVEAPDGEVGLELFRAKPTDLVITDILMPNKEGIETIREFRRDFPELKIIAMSGGGRVDSNAYLNLAKKFGATRVYEKTADWSRLVKMVSEVLSTE